MKSHLSLLYKQLLGAAERSSRVCKTMGLSSIVLLLLGLFGQPANAQEINLNFADGLLPSTKGWTFQGQDQFQQPLSESQAASVSNGVLHLDTVPFGGVGASALAFWRIGIAGIDPANYEYEIRMRAIAPNSFRSCFGGLLGGGLEVRGNFDSDLTLMQPQLSLGGFAPASSSDPCLELSIDGSVFHTYKLVVQDSTQAALFVDGTQVAQGTLTRPNTLALEAVFGDLSTSGGNVTTDIEFIRIAPLAITVDIDIKPGSPGNSINPKSIGVIPVAVLSTATFDATSIDPSTVRFGATGTEAAAVQFALEDVDRDGRADLIMHFRTRETGIVCGTTTAGLTGTTFGGQAIKGSDSVTTTGCN